MTDRSYDPNVVIQAADAKLAQNDLDSGIMMFQTALLSWVDDARENSSAAAGMDPEQMREAIATLWIAYAHFLQKAKQFKSATEAYEQAVNDPVAGAVGRIWLDYARFAEDRGKLRTAQNVYLRALVGMADVSNDHQPAAVTDGQDQSLLWGEFLEMMRKNNPALTLQSLKEAVQQEHAPAVSATASVAASGDVAMADVPDAPTSSTSFPEVQASASDAAVPSVDSATAATTSAPAAAIGGTAQQPAPKRARLDTPDAGTHDETSRTHVVVLADVKVEESALKEIVDKVDEEPNFMATWMMRDGDSPPEPPNPPLFAPARPKLSDANGKDLLGGELALALIRRLLQRSGGVVLDVARSLWYLTAVKEKQQKLALDRIDEQLKGEVKKLNERLAERLSSAIFAGAAEASIRQMNDSERHSFEITCNQRRQRVLSKAAWDFRQLLWTQQLLLSKLNVPGFNGPTVDGSVLDLQSRVCSYLHSAFYLRTHIGEAKHAGMLKLQEERLVKSGVQTVDPASFAIIQDNNNNNAMPPPGFGAPQHNPGMPPYGTVLPPPPPPPPPMMAPGQPQYPGPPGTYMQPQQQFQGVGMMHHPAGGPNQMNYS